MKIKFLGTKVLIVFTTMLATPIVWAALAWPEWSNAAPAENLVAIEQPAPQEPQVLIQPVVHRVVIVPRYVEVEATPVINPIQPQVAAPVPAGTTAPVPTAPPTSVPQAVVPPKQTLPKSVQQPAASGSSGGSSSSSASSNPPVDTAASSANNSQSSAPAPSNSKTKGS